MTLEELLSKDIQLEELQAGMILSVDKPYEWTSFDVIRKLQGHWKYKKIGHAGTLDPLATGLLILATGKCTKKIESIQGQQKTYIADIKLGATTKSYDAEFPEENITDTSHISQDQVEEIIKNHLTGSIEQIPPDFSALKVNGKRAYKLAREGKKVEIKPRQVQVDTFTVTKFEQIEKDGITSTHIQATIECSKGTYIRSLAFDLGKLSKTGGYLTDLRRAKIGDYKI